MLKLIIGIGIINYLPRVLPLVFLSDKKLNPFIEKFLSYIPQVSLSILIVRGIMNTSEELLIPTLVGIIAATIMSYIKGNLVVAVITTIVASFISLQIMG